MRSERWTQALGDENLTKVMYLKQLMDAEQAEEREERRESSDRSRLSSWNRLYVCPFREISSQRPSST